MSVETITALLAGAGVLVSLAGFIFTSGRLTERINENSRNINEHAKILKEHAVALSEHEVSLGRLQEWKDGYNAAVRTSTKTQ